MRNAVVRDFGYNEGHGFLWLGFDRDRKLTRFGSGAAVLRPNRALSTPCNHHGFGVRPTGSANSAFSSFNAAVSSWVRCRHTSSGTSWSRRRPSTTSFAFCVPIVMYPSHLAVDPGLRRDDDLASVLWPAQRRLWRATDSDDTGADSPARQTQPCKTCCETSACKS